ncbi:hypothetical protein [Ornithinimicrobium sp. Y1694]|uniref:hypothetical protein n=1 Tax=Ornithinimicrobium sp. Y1694 TaxID=3418590 RepID=UPI003CECBB97
MSPPPTPGLSTVPTPRGGRAVTRRSLLLGGLGVGALGAGGVSASRVLPPTWLGREELIPLYSAGVAFGPSGERAFVAPGDNPFPPGTRVLPASGEVNGIRAAERELVSAVRSRVAPRWEPLTVDAILDINALTYGLPGPAAAWTRHWRYIWPRDSAHVCAALAGLDRPDDVLRCLAFLAEHQRKDGHFEARYTFEGTVPDDRTPQSDGVGWFLWAIRECCQALPEHRAALLATTGPAASRALRAIEADLRLLGTDGLPPPSPDYWEVPERRTTLGIAAMTLAGLQAAAELGEDLCPEAATAADLATDLREAIRGEFGRRGFQRYVRGGGYDAALTFLLPPYVTGLEDEVAPLLDVAHAAMLRPAGGVAPGESWKDDWISWTPETALFAQAYAHVGRTADAEEALAWLAAHRTSTGSLPEKVLSDGSPAAVAPLSWTGALVISTALRLASTG